MNKDLLVSRECDVLPPNMPSFRCRIGVLKPEQIGQWQWKCKVQLDGIVDEERLVMGIDEWHTLQLGMEMIFTELEFKQMQGWRFLWFEGDSDDLKQLLPRLGREAV
jgi:hypothetical protein